MLEDGRDGETYLIGGEGERRNLEVVEAIADLVDEMSDPPPGRRSRRDLISFVADRPGHDLRYAIDAGKVRSDLGWKPVQDFASGLRKTVRWYLDNLDWWNRVQSGAYRGQRLGLATSERSGSAT